MENSMEVPWKTKNVTTVWSSSLNHGHVFGENHNLKRQLHPSVHSNTIYNAQDMEATWLHIKGGMDKEDVVHIYDGILLNHGKE